MDVPVKKKCEPVTNGERISALWCSEQYADVHFQCIDKDGLPQIIPGHKFYLRLCSEMFASQFYGDMSEDMITIKDVPAEAFKEFLRYLYTNRFEGTLQLGPILLYCAKKYLVFGMEKRVASYINNQLKTYTSACLPCLENMKHYNMSESVAFEKCLQLIEKNAAEAVKNEAFYGLDADVVGVILQRDDLDVDEAELFRALVSWSAKQSQCANQPLSLENQKKLMEPLLAHIRFPDISPNQLAILMNECQVLNKETIAELVLAYGNKDRQRKLPFSQRPARHGELSLAGGYAADWPHDAVVPGPFLSGNTNGEDGTIRYVIDNFENFVRHANVHLSGRVFVRNMAWRIDAHVSQDRRQLGMFLRCDGPTDTSANSRWSCAAKNIQFRILSHNGDNAYHKNVIHHRTLTSNEKDWGFSSVISVQDIRDSTNGWLVDNKLILEVCFQAEHPQIV